MLVNENDLNMVNALSVDLEDWYQGLTSTSQQVERWPEHEDRVVENTNRLLEIFTQAGVKATFFVLGYVAEKHPDLIRKVAKRGHEIGLHGYYHRFVTRLTPDELRAEILRGRKVVEEASEFKVLGYRAPYFSINQGSLWVLELLRDLGFCYDSSVFPTRNMLYGYPGAPRFPYRPFDKDDFVEFPLSTVRVMGVNWPVAGGFYLRVLPYTLFKRGLKQINYQKKPAIIYIHPWELDPQHPRPNPTLRERFTHYYNLEKTEDKLTALLKDFHFAPLADLLDHPPCQFQSAPY